MRDPRPTAPAKTLLSTLLLSLVLVAAAPPARAVTIQEIPSPRPTGWSVDLTGRIPKATLTEIDRVGDEVKARNGAELAVVVVGTTSGVPSHTFATNLANTWGIGERGKDNGVLVFVALDDRRIEIVLGNGLASPALQEASAAILQGDMVPLLRQGDPAGAVLAGARACARRLLEAPPTAPTNSFGAILAPSKDETAPQSVVQPPAPIQPAAAPPATFPAANSSNGTAGIVLALLGFGALGVLGWVAYKLVARPRPCPQCGAPMERLSAEAGEAALPLTAIEQIENRLGSVTVQVYRCSSCGALDKASRRHPLSGYESCPQCKAVALSKRQSTVRAASYDHEGLVQTEWQCLSCSYHDSSTSTLPRLFHQDHSASTTAAAFLSSSSDSSSSSSSSSDSGFGGGSSSGDGASGSW